jgi:uncharacterized metal-binding protein
LPNGIRHQSATVALALPIWPMVYMLSGSPVTATLVTEGVLTGLLISPDLDVDSGCIHHAIIRQTFGEVIGLAWELYWWPYAKAFKHRGVSHWFIIGTLTRLIYLAPLWVVLPILGFQLWTYDNLYWVLGLVLADGLHGLLDWVDIQLGGIL